MEDAGTEGRLRAPLAPGGWGWLLAPLLLGLVAWGSDFWNREFDYDEVMQAHAIWQISQGLVPFRDFFECHPPFLWYPFVPVLPLLPDGPELLFGLRVLSGLGVALWLKTLLYGARQARPSLPTAWLVLAGCLVAFQHHVLDYAVQFRPDTFAWAGAFAALARFQSLQTRAVSRRRACAELGLAGTLLVLALPKLAVLFPAYAGIDLARRARAGAPLLPDLGGYALGAAAGSALALLFLFAVGIDPVAAWQLSLGYHAVVVAGAGFTLGVREVVLMTPFALVVSLLGIAAWAGWLAREKLAPTTLELAVLATLVAQVAFVRIPHVQYVAPVFLLSALFLPYTGLWARQLGARWRPAPICAEAAAAGVAVCAAGLALAGSWGTGDAARYAQVQHAVLELAPHDSRIVVPPPFHPVVRRDALYGLIHTWLPSGLTTEQAMREYDLPYAERRGPEAYRADLERGSPAVILFTGNKDYAYSPEQHVAIAAYLASHSTEYLRVPGLNPTLWVRADLVAAAESRPAP